VLEDYVPRSFRIRAIRITEENIAEVAEMMNSEVKRRHFASGYKNHFEIVEGPYVIRTQVYVGDWLTWMGGNFKRYTNKMFKYSFEKPVIIDMSDGNSSKLVENSVDRMEREHHTDPEIHARNEKVLQLVRKALRQGIPEDTTQHETPQDIAYKIIKLFY